MFRGRQPTGQDDTLYKELGLNKNATASEIKKSYRQLALKHHPDRGGDPEKFKKIQAAYEVLSDNDKKNKYDKFGMDGLNENHVQFEGHDIFDMFFGGRTRRPQRQRRGKDTIHHIKLCLEDLYNGKKIKLGINRKVIDGKAKKCEACNGNGVICEVRQLGPGFCQQIQRTCEYCNGTGYMCNFKIEKKTIEFVVEPGTLSNHKVTFSGLGNEHPGIEPGDVIIVIDTKPHTLFARKDNDLFIKIRISLIEALTGCSFDITHLDGRNLTIHTEKSDILGLMDGKQTPLRCVLQEGMPLLNGHGRKGNLIVAFAIDFPKTNNFSNNEISLLEKILPKPLHVKTNSTNTKCEMKTVDASYINKLNQMNHNNEDDFDGTPQCVQS